VKLADLMKGAKEKPADDEEPTEKVDAIGELFGAIQDGDKEGFAEAFRFAVKSCSHKPDTESEED
jgi:hypothetical protein